MLPAAAADDYEVECPEESVAADLDPLLLKAAAGLGQLLWKAAAGLGPLLWKAAAGLGPLLWSAAADFCQLLLKLLLWKLAEEVLFLKLFSLL